MPRGKRGVKRQRTATTPTEADDLECRLEEMSIELDRRCEKIRAHADSTVCALRSALSIQLTKLPHYIREMKLNDFLEEFGGDLTALTSRNRAVAAKPEAPRTVLKSRAGALNEGAPPATVRRAAKRQAVPMKGAPTPTAKSYTATPARFHPHLPKTPAGMPAYRAPRRGESIVSVNGSPLGVYSKSTAARATIGVPATPAGGKENGGTGAENDGEDTQDDALPIAIDVELSNGETVNLGEAGFAEDLTEDDRELVRQKLEALQQRVNTIITTL